MTRKQKRERLRQIAFYDARNWPNKEIAAAVGCDARTVIRYRKLLRAQADGLDRPRLIAMLNSMLSDAVSTKDSLSIIDRIVALLPPPAAPQAAPDAASAFLANILATPDDTDPDAESAPDPGG